MSVLFSSFRSVVLSAVSFFLLVGSLQAQVPNARPSTASKKTSATISATEVSAILRTSPTDSTAHAPFSIKIKDGPVFAGAIAPVQVAPTLPPFATLGQGHLLRHFEGSVASISNPRTGIPVRVSIWRVPPAEEFSIAISWMEDEQFHALSGELEPQAFDRNFASDALPILTEVDGDASAVEGLSLRPRCGGVISTSDDVKRILNLLSPNSSRQLTNTQASSQSTANAAAADQAASWRIISIGADADTSFLDAYGGAAGARARIEVLINLLNTITQNQLNAIFLLAFVHTFDRGNDPYDPNAIGVNAVSALSELTSRYNSRPLSGTQSWQNLQVSWADFHHLFVSRTLTLSDGERNLAGLAGGRNSLTIASQRIETAVSNLAHELGHSMGAQHDSAQDRNNRRFIMYPFLGQSWTYSPLSHDYINLGLPSRPNPRDAVQIVLDRNSSLGFLTDPIGLEPFPTNGSFEVAWQRPEGGEVHFYEVFRSVMYGQDSGPNQCQGEPYGRTLTESFIDNALPSDGATGVYYSVRAVGPRGVSNCRWGVAVSHPSIWNVRLSASKGDVPDAVSLKASLSDGNSVTTPTYYARRAEFYVANGAGGEYVLLKSVNVTAPFNGSAGIYAYDELAPSDGSHRFYKVRLCNVLGCSELNQSPEEIGFRGTPQVPPPTEVTATKGTLSNTELTWEPVQGATGYNVYQVHPESGYNNRERLTRSPVNGVHFRSQSEDDRERYYCVTALRGTSESACGAMVLGYGISTVRSLSLRQQGASLTRSVVEVTIEAAHLPHHIELYLSDTALTPGTWVANLVLQNLNRPFASYEIDVPADGRARFVRARTATVEGGYSDFETVSTLPPFGVYREPSDQAVALSKPVTFFVGVYSRNPVYQWFMNGTPVEGGTSDTLNLTATSALDHAQITCRIRYQSDHGPGEYTTPPAELRALDLPTNLRAQSFTDYIRLTWDSPIAWTPASYELYSDQYARGCEGYQGDSQEIAEIAGNANSYLHGSVVAGDIVNYLLYANFQSRNGSITPFCFRMQGSRMLNAPQQLSVSLQNQRPRVVWSGVNGRVRYYLVYRALSADQAPCSGDSWEVSGNTYTVDYQAHRQATNYYSVRAVGQTAAVEGECSSVVSIWVP